jgi:ech hydrogenase subunit F
MFDFLGSVLTNLMSKPATRMYPYEVRTPMKDARGQLGEIDINACIFCGICARKCPSIALSVNKSDKSWEVDIFKCIVCGECVVVCPVKCLKMEDVHRPSTYSRDKSKHIQPPKPVVAETKAEA